MLNNHRYNIKFLINILTAYYFQDSELYFRRVAILIFYSYSCILIIFYFNIVENLTVKKLREDGRGNMNGKEKIIR